MNKIRFSFLCFFSCLMISLTYAQNGLDFDGVNDYVQTNYSGISGNNSRTIEAWIKADAVTNQAVITDWGTLATGKRFTFNLIDGKLRTEVQGSGQTGTTVLSDTTWHHVAVSYDNSLSTNKFSMYIDGSLEMSFDLATAVNTGSSVDFRIGSRIDDVRYFKGGIDEVRVWNYARSMTEISADMNNEFCGSEVGLVAYHKLNHGIASGTNTNETLSVDDSGNANDGDLFNFSLSGASSNWVSGESLTLGGSVTVTQTITECVGYSITVGSNTYTSTGVYLDTIVSGAGGCDSIITTDLTIISSITETQTITECDGYSISVGSNTYTSTGIYTDTIVVGAGGSCDSIIITDLTINSPTTETQTITACDGYSITVSNNTYTITGVYTDTIAGGTVGGCDSIIITDLTINSLATETQTITACDGYSLTVSNNTYTTTGVYTDTIVGGTVGGCDSIIITDLIINSPVSETQTITLCDGDSITVLTNTYTTTGVYMDTIAAGTVGGCDSIIITDLTIVSSITETQTITGCDGYSITVLNNTYTITGVYMDTIVDGAVGGCDSIIITDLTINSPVTESQTISGCEGDSIMVGSNTYTSTGVYTDTIAGGTIGGCDSIIITDLTINSPATETQTITECDGYSITVSNNTYTITGVYTDTIVGGTVGGCDSIIITDLTIDSLATETQTITACDGYSITVLTNTYTSTGVYMDTIVDGAVGGCDSIIITDLTINSPITETQTIALCVGDSITVSNNTYTTTGVYMDTIAGGTVGGCDSIIITDLTINSPATETQTITECDGYSIAVSNNTYTITGVYTDTIVGGTVGGCDSIIITDLTINPLATETQTITACDGYSITVSNNTYTITGVYTDTIASGVAGVCDSIIITDLTINSPATETQTIAACDGYSITVLNNTYTTTGVYMDTITGGAVVGCDSIIITDLTINSAVTETQVITECDGYSITVGSNTYTSTGVYTDTIVGGTVGGCDSIIITDLAVNSPITISQVITECAGYSITVSNSTYTTTGVYTDTIIGGTMVGCDSIIITDLTINGYTEIAQSLEVCFGESVTVGGSVYVSNGTYLDTVANNSAGCDTVFTTSVNILSEQVYTQTIEECFGYTVTVGGNTHSASGVYIDVLTSASVNGCDSTVTTSLTIIDDIDTSLVVSGNVLSVTYMGVDYQWLNCDSNYAPIIGETGPVFIPTVDGNYAVEIADGSCIDTSSCYGMFGIGLGEYALNGGSVISPNPIRDKVLIQLDEGFATAKVTVVDISGKKQLEFLDVEGQIEMDMSELSMGIYFVQIQDGKYEENIKIMKL